MYNRSARPNADVSFLVPDVTPSLAEIRYWGGNYGHIIILNVEVVN